MKNIKYTLLLLVSLLVINACKDEMEDIKPKEEPKKEVVKEDGKPKDDTTKGDDGTTENDGNGNQGGDDSKPEPTLKISPDNDSYTLSSGVNQIQITFIPENGYKYVVEITNGNDWLTAKKNNDVYTFESAENNSTSKREAIITIKKEEDNSIFKTIKVTQEGKEMVEETPSNNEKWTQGVVPPTQWEYFSWDKDKEYPYVMETSGNSSGWYDIDKEGRYLDGETYINDVNSCWLIVATNMLHWWYDRNKDNIERYNKINGTNIEFTYNNTAEKDRDRSNVYSKIRKAFRKYQGGGHAGDAIRWYLSGSYNYPNSLGVFKDVIPPQELLYTSYERAGNLKEFSKYVKEKIDKGDILGISYEAGRTAHVITIWGVKLDNNGDVSGIYVTNSDDKQHIMYKLRIIGKDNKIYFKTTTGGVKEIFNVYYLEQGKKFWNDYFAKHGG